MNRRKFLLAASSGVAFFANSATARQSSQTDTLIISELTNAEIDFSESGFTFLERETEESAENISLQTPTGSVNFLILPTGSVDSQALVDRFMNAATAQGATIHDLGSESLDDGIWRALVSELTNESVGYYIEYQNEAFQDLDIVIELRSDPARFHDEFALMQTISFGGSPPFLFLEESKVESLDYSVTKSSSTRTSQNKGSSTSPRAKRTTPSKSGDGATFAQAISDQRTVHANSINKFFKLLEDSGKPDVSEAQTREYIDALVDIALTWQTYPDVAAELKIPGDYEELGNLYLDWADAVGLMGGTFDEFTRGIADADAFLQAVDDWELLDADLETALVEVLGIDARSDYPTKRALGSARKHLKMTAT